MTRLDGKKVAIIVDNYFEEAELAEPMRALQDAGATVDIIAPEAGTVQAMQHDTDKAQIFTVDHTFADADFDDYDAMVVPGGTVNADKLRTVPAALDAIKTFITTGRPLAVICHGPWTLVSAGIARGRRLTSFFSLQDDLRNAGADWADEAVVIDDNLITSRNPDDLPAFNDALLTMMAKA
jgi:protease I